MSQIQAGPEASVSGDSGQCERMLPALGVIVDHLLAAARGDQELRSALRELAGQILEATAQPQASAGAALVAADELADQRSDVAELTSPASPAEQLFFMSRPQPAAVAPALPRVAAVAEVVTPAPPARRIADELPWIEKRCRLKVEAARWAATRMRRLAQGADYRSEVEPQDQQLISQARQMPDCFLWMCHASAPMPGDPQQWNELADCFETLSDAVALGRLMIDHADQDRDLFEQSLDLLAEAQSMLRSAVTQINDRDDLDQVKAHRWLQCMTSEHGIYIKRYMRADDHADPSDLPQLAQRLDDLRAQWQMRHDRRRDRRAGLTRVRYHCQQLARGSVDATHDWSVILRTVDELVEAGMPPSDAELRELLLPWIEQMPELGEISQHFESVRREMDRYLANRPADERATAPSEEHPQVAEVRRLLAGRSVVLVGGLRRPHSQAKLRQAFALGELRWEQSMPHQSLHDFEPAIARPEVAVVLLAIRWSSHSFGGLKAICDQLGKPLVRLPAGYGVNRVAAEILAQCSEQLVTAQAAR